MSKKNDEPQVIWTQEYGPTISAYKKLIELINEFANEYEKIMDEPFSADIIKLFSKNDFLPISAKFSQKADEAISQTPSFGSLKTQQQGILNDQLAHLKKLFDKMVNDKNDLQFHHLYYISLFWEELRVIDNRAIWEECDTQRINRKYFTLYASDIDAQLRERIDSFVKSWNELTFALIGDNRPPTPPADPGYNYMNPRENILMDYLFYVQDNGRIAPNWPVLFKPVLEYKEDINTNTQS